MCGCGKLTVRKNKKPNLALILKRKTQLANKKKQNENKLKLNSSNNSDDSNDKLEFNPTPGLIGQTTAQVRGGGVGVRKIRKHRRSMVKGKKGMKGRK